MHRSALIGSCLLVACASAPDENDTSSTAVTSAAATKPALVWNGSSYSAVWQESDTSRFRMMSAKLAEDGTLLAPAVAGMPLNGDQRYRVGRCGAKTMIVYERFYSLYAADFDHPELPPELLAPLGRRRRFGTEVPRAPRGRSGPHPG